MIEVSAGEAAVLIDSGGVLLDVREAEEWVAGHVAGALFIPIGEIQARLDEIPSDRRVVVICRSGGRSAVVTEALNSVGVDAVNLAGGITAWSSEGRPVVTDGGNPGKVI